MNPDRYAVIYNSKYDNDNDNIFESYNSTTAAAISSFSSYQSTSKSLLQRIPWRYFRDIKLVTEDVVKSASRYDDGCSCERTMNPLDPKVTQTF